MPTYSRLCRLVSQRDFEFVFAQPFKVSHKHLLALYRPNDRLHARLGIIISKQRARRAVERNQLRRVIRESFRQFKARLKGLDIVVLLRSEWSPLGTKNWRIEVDNLWQRLINS